MPNAEDHQLHLRLGDARAAMRRCEERLPAAIDAIRRRIILYETPADLDIEQLSAVVQDLAALRAEWIKARDDERRLRSLIGLGN